MFFERERSVRLVFERDHFAKSVENACEGVRQGNCRENYIVSSVER